MKGLGWVDCLGHFDWSRASCFLSTFLLSDIGGRSIVRTTNMHHRYECAVYSGKFVSYTAVLSSAEYSCINQATLVGQEYKETPYHANCALSAQGDLHGDAALQCVDCPWCACSVSLQVSLTVQAMLHGARCLQSLFPRECLEASSASGVPVWGSPSQVQTMHNYLIWPLVLLADRGSFSNDYSKAQTSRLRLLYTDTLYVHGAGKHVTW